MAYEFLKKLFTANEDGTPKAMTYEELEAAIDADKEIKVANLSSGEYVAKHKLDDKITELKGVQKQLDDANAQIKSFAEQDVEGIKQKVSDWEAKYNTDTQALKDQMAQQQRSHAEEMFLSGYRFSSKAARNGVLAELQSKKFQIDESGTILGGREFMQSLMENEDYKGAFVTEQTKAGEQGEATPRFSKGAGGTQPPAGSGEMFNFGFQHLRQPKSN